MKTKVNTKLLDHDGLQALRKKFPKAKIVQCHGVFDVLHAGHLAYFESAKRHGDVLVVTVTADPFVNKGPGRPYFNSSVRSSMVGALEIVDYVAVNNHALAVPAIEALRPDFYVKGPDYKDMSADYTGGIKLEAATVQKCGGKLVFTEDETHSASGLINKFFGVWTDDQQKAIEAVKAIGGTSIVEEVLQKLAKEKVLVVGEPIVDTYNFCIPEGISSKSPSISAKFLYEENYAGGALAIANHLSDFTQQVTLLFTHGGEPYFRALLEEKIDPRVQVMEEALNNVPTPRKTRFIAVDKAQRIFEITDLRSDQWLSHDSNAFCEQLSRLNEGADATLLADFGHGLFEGRVLEAAGRLKGFVGLNVQTNSSNLGYNPFTKHKRFSYLSIDTKEVRVAYHDRYTATLDLAHRLKRDVGAIPATVGMTLGPNGCYYFPLEGETERHCPAFADSVVDATGAGDAFFALTSVLIKIGCPDVLIPFLGNVYAGLKTKIVGNKSSVTKAQLVKAVSAILK